MIAGAGDMKTASDRLNFLLPNIGYRDSVLCHGYAGMFAAARWEAHKMTPLHQRALIQRTSALYDAPPPSFPCFCLLCIAHPLMEWPFFFFAFSIVC